MITEQELMQMKNDDALKAIDRAAKETLYNLFFSFAERDIELSEEMQDIITGAMCDFEELGIYTACVVAKELNEADEAARASRIPRAIKFIQ